MHHAESGDNRDLCQPLYSMATPPPPLSCSVPSSIATARQDTGAAAGGAGGGAGREERQGDDQAQVALARKAKLAACACWAPRPLSQRVVLLFLLHGH